MPLPGGLSDKVGNRYEDRWTVRCAIDVLDNKADAIRLEPPGPQDDGVEFWVRFPDRVEYHQCKRQRTREGVWNLGALSSAGVLSTFLDKLKAPESSCVFVSTHATDALGELADRARDAISYEEFVAVSLAAPEWKSKFEKLCRAWGNLDGTAAFDALHRVHVTTIGEAELKAMNRLQAELVLAGDTDKSVPILTDILRDNAGRYLTPVDLWSALRSSGYEPNPWRSEQGLAVRVEAANRRFCGTREDTLIAGSLIHRPEAQQLRELVESEPVVLVDGDAGAGKSDVLLQLIRGLEEEGIAHLALRLDRITPTALPEDVGAELNLPASPVVTLLAHAQGETGVLVIDQLDIVSSTSGRSPRFFDCVKEMIEAAAGMPNLRVVLSCRTFDVANDGRLRRLVLSGEASVITVGPLAIQQVFAAIETLGFDAERLSEPQRKILAVPLHLALLAEIAPTLLQESRVLGFVEASDLFRTFWDHKRTEVQHRLDRPPAWTEVLDAVVDYMSENQLLRAPIEVADQWQTDLTDMISSHVLTKDGGHVAFFHESFFDYVFARRFASRQRAIADLLATDQGLFRRAQVRQILAYNRGRGDQYLKDLQYMLTDEGVQFHLRDVVIAWLARVSPTEAEWGLLRPHLDNPQSLLHARAWRTVATPNWFTLLDQSGYVEACLDSADETRIARALNVLVCGNGQFLDRALDMLRRHVNESVSWTKHLVWFLQHVDLTVHRSAFDLLLQLLDSCTLGDTGFAGRDFWYLTDKLPAANPSWANELLGHYLEERMAAAATAGLSSPFDSEANLMPRQLALHDYICIAAATDSGSFFSDVWPRLLRLVEASLFDQRGDRLRSDRIWPFRHLSNGSRDFRDDLLAGAELAFAARARENPDQMRALVDDLSATRSETVVHLIFESFAANPERFADDAIGALAAHPDWLEVSWSNGHAWGTRKLVEAVTPHASGKALTQLDSLLLAYYPPFERSATGHDQFGWTQFTLLGGIVPERHSARVVKRLAELRRKFGCDDVPMPQGISGGVVQSPISTDATKKMSDSNWRGAIARYAGERDTIFRSGGAPVGGAPQLANQLEAEARTSPERFASLAVNLPDGTDPRYFNAVLRGVADSDMPLPTEQIEELLLRCHRVPRRPCGMHITRPLLRCADKRISGAMVELITWYAGSDPGPADENPNPDVDNIDEWLLYRGLNSVRGAVAEVITQLIWRNAENIEPLKPAAMSLVGDGSAGVRAVAAQIVIALLHWDSGEAFSLFERLIEDAPDEILASRHVFTFLHYRIGVDFSRLRHVVERMIGSQVGEVQMHGAALATLAALSDETATATAYPCLEGTERHRLGAARVYAANLTTARFRQQCAEALLQLFDDESQLVRDAAAEVVGQFSGTELGDFSDVVQGLINSKAAANNWDAILEAQVETSSAATDLALAICERVLASGTDAAESSSSYRWDLLSQILVRVYTDAGGDAKSRALDLINLSLQQEIRAAERALAVHDRGWQ
jgi:hypothetical protein